MPFDDFLRQNYPQLGGNLTQTPVPGMTAPIQFTPMPNTQPGSAAATQVQQQNQAVLYQQEVNRRNAEVAARQEQEQQRIAAEQEGRGGGFFQPVRAVIDAVADYPRNIANAVSNLGHDRNFLSPAAWGGAALTAASPAFALGDMTSAYWKEARGEILYRVAAGDNWFFDALGMLMPMGFGITLKGIYMGLDAGLSDEAKRGIMDAHDNGYKGFTGGTAVYEMAMGITDDWHPIAKYSFRIVNEVVNDPMTWVGVGAAARLSSVGKLGAIGRSEEAYNALGAFGKAKAVASDVRQLKDPLVAVDTAMRGVNYVPDQVMFGLPGKAIRAADTATGGHLFRQSGQAARRHIEAQEQETLADFARATEPTTMPTDPGTITLPGGQQVPDVEPGDPVRGTYLLPTGEGEAPPPIPGFDTTIDMAPERKVRVRYTLRDQQTGDPSFIDILDDGTYRVMPAGENTWHPVSTLDTAFDWVASTVPNPPPTQRSPVGPNPTYERQQRYAAEGGIPTDVRPQRDITVRGTTDGQSAVWEVNHRGKNRSLYIRRQPNGYFRISDEAGSMIPGPEYTKYGDAYEAATSYLLQQPYRYQVDPYGRPLHPAAVPRPDGGRVIDEAYRLTQENPGVPQWIWFWRRYKEIEQQYAPVIDREQGMIDKTTGLKRDLPAGDPDALERGLTVDTYVKTLAESNIAFYSDYLSMIVNNGERVAQTQRGWRGTPSEQIAAFMFGPGKKRGDVFQSDLNRAEAIREAILTDDEEASRIIIDYFRKKRRVMLSEEQAKSVLLPGAQLRPGAKRKDGYVNLANVLEANRSRRREMFLNPEEPPLLSLPQGDIPGPRMVPADPLVTPPPAEQPGRSVAGDAYGLYTEPTPAGLEMRPAPSGMTGEVPANLDLVRDQLADVEIRHANIPTDDPRYNGVLEAVSTAREDLNTVLASRRKGSSREMRGAAFARAQYYLQEADRLEGLIADPSQIVTPPPTRMVERDVLVRPPRVPRLETIPVEQEPLGTSRPADFTVPPPVAEQPGLSTPPNLPKSMLRGERAPAAPRPPRQAAPAPAPAPEPLLPVREAAPSNDDIEFGDLGLPAPDLTSHRRRMNEIAGKTERFASAEKVNPNLTPEQVSGFKAAARLTLRQSEELDRLAREIETARAALLKIKDPAQRDQAWTRILNMKDEYDELAGTNSLADIKAILERTPVRQAAPATPARQAPEPAPADPVEAAGRTAMEGEVSAFDAEVEGRIAMSRVEEMGPLATDAQAFTPTTGEPAPPLNRFQKAGQTRRMNRLAAEPGMNVGAEEFTQTTRRPVGANMSIPGLSRRQLVEEALEPPVPEGHTRLYRVSAKPGSGPKAPDWVIQARKQRGVDRWEGRWFATDPDISAFYYKDSGDITGAKVTYIDVPNEQVDQYRVSNITDNDIEQPNRYSLDPENEFFVSPEMAAGAQEIPGLDILTAARRQELDWPTPKEPLITVDEETGRFPWDPEPERPMVEVTGAEPPPDITLMADTPLVKRVRTRPQGSPNRAEEMWGQVLTGDEDEASSALDSLVYDITGGQVQRDAPNVDESASGGTTYTIRDEADGIPSVQIRKGDVPIRENGEVVGGRPGLYLIAPGGSDDPVVKNIIARAGDGVPVEVVRGGGDMLGTPMGLTGPSEMGLPDPLWDPVYRMWRMAQIDDTERELLEEILPISGGKNAKTMRLADLYLLNRSQSDTMNEAIEKTMRTFRKHRNVARRESKEAAGQYARLRKVLRVYDTLTDNIRERLMFNPYTGAVSAMLDHVGDTARMLSVGEFRAARNAWKPSSWRAGFEAARGENSWLMATDGMKVAAKLGMDAPTELAPSLGREGLDRTRGLSFDRMIEGFTENKSGQRKLKRILAAAGFRGSDFILELRSGGDIARRSSLFGEEIARQLPKYRDEFFEEVDRVAARRPGFDAEGFKRSLGDAFSPTDVRLLSMDHGLDVGQAEHLMRNWKSKHKPLREAGLARSKEVLFSYDQTNVDQVLRRVFLFHYWYTRASVAYTRTILKNPYLYTNYMRMTEGLEKMAEDQPSSVKGMIKAFTGPGGYAIFMDPLKVVSTAVTFRRQAFQDGDDTAFDQFLDTTGLFLNPMIAAASAVLGATSNERVDPLATFQIRRVGGAAINAINAETGLFGGSYLGTPFQDKMGKAVQELSDIFGDPNYARDTAATEKVLIRTGIMDRVMARHGIEQGTEFGLWPSQAMMELQEALDAFDTGRPNPDADAAYRDWARGNLVRQTASLVAPVGVSMRSNARDARTRTARMTGTDRYDAELDITAAAPEATDLTIQRARFDSLFPSNEMGRVTESPLTGQTQAEVLAEPGMSDYTQYRDWRNAARDMGANTFRERMRRISPSYAAYIERQEAELGDVFAEDPDYYDNISTSYQAFLAAQGERASAYDPASPPSLDMGSVNASTFVTGGYGGGTPPLQEEDLGSRITGQLIGYHQQQQEFNRLVQQYFGQEVVFDLLSPQGQAYIRQQLGPMGIRLPSLGEEAAGYQAWSRVQPMGSDTSIAAYVRWLETRAASGLNTRAIPMMANM